MSYFNQRIAAIISNAAFSALFSTSSYSTKLLDPINQPRLRFKVLISGRNEYLPSSIRTRYQPLAAHQQVRGATH